MTQCILIYFKSYLYSCTGFCVAKALRKVTCSKGGLDEFNRAQEILPVYKTDWHLVFSQCSDTYLVIKEKESLQLVSCVCVVAASQKLTEIDSLISKKLHLL